MVRDTWKSVYEEAFKIELSRRRLYLRDSQKEIKIIVYLDIEIGLHRLDLVVEDKVIVELKAIKEFADIHFAQLRSYLKATRLKMGLIVEFCKTHCGNMRIVLKFKFFKFRAFVLS